MKPDELNELRKHLPRGWNRQTARELEISPATITGVLSGKVSNPKVLGHLISLAEENKTLKEKYSKRIQNLKHENI